MLASLEEQLEQIPSWHMQQWCSLLKTFSQQGLKHVWKLEPVWRGAFKSGAVVVVLIYKMSLYMLMHMAVVLVCLSGIYMHFFSCMEEMTQSNRDSEASYWSCTIQSRHQREVSCLDSLNFWIFPLVLFSCTCSLPSFSAREVEMFLKQGREQFHTEWVIFSSPVEFCHCVLLVQPAFPWRDCTAEGKV